MYALTFYMPNTDAVRALLYALLAVAAVVVAFPVMAVMPSVVGCCVLVLPVVGKMLLGAVIIAAFAFVTKPK